MSDAVYSAENGVVIANQSAVNNEGAVFTDDKTDRATPPPLHQPEPPQACCTRLKGIFFMLLGSLIHSTIGALVKKLDRIPSGKDSGGVRC